MHATRIRWGTLAMMAAMAVGTVGCGKKDTNQMMMDGSVTGDGAITTDGDVVADGSTSDASTTDGATSDGSTTDSGDTDAAVDAGMTDAGDTDAAVDSGATDAGTDSAVVCGSGFTRNPDTNMCDDINECITGPSPCGANATCTNTPGSFRCGCSLGFAGDGTTCAPGVSQVQFGVGFGCLLTQSNEMYCWGQNVHGELGTHDNISSRGPATGPSRAAGAHSILQIATGNSFACYVSEDASVKCFGADDFGQLGDNSTLANMNSAVTVSGGLNSLSITAGAQHACAIQTDQTVKCWGRNAEGQLGDGTNTRRPTPVSVTGVTGAIALSAGASHTCALLMDRSVVCWGLNTNGELGDGTYHSRSSAGDVVANAVETADGSPLANVIALESGAHFTCAITSDGALSCWGDNSSGQLGVAMLASELANSSAALPVPSLTKVRALDSQASASSICAVTGDDIVSCWGANDGMQLGDGTTDMLTAPRVVTGFDRPQFVAVGANNACVVTQAGAFDCWGSNDNGQLADGTTTSRPTAHPAGSALGIQMLSTGGFHTCALGQDARVSCWGYGAFGQLGNGFATDSSEPQTVSGISTAIQVAAGDTHTCVLLNDNTVECFGNNTNGQIGDGTSMNTRLSPTPVSGLTNAAFIAAGYRHTCAVLQNGDVSCWGSNIVGQLGDGTDDSTVPVAVPGVANVATLAAGIYHTCALLNDGNVTCWGANAHGELGNGVMGAVSGPVAVQGINASLDPAVSIEAGAYHTCVVTMSGATLCWGKNSDGQLGLGETDTTDRAMATIVTLSPAYAVSAGFATTCAFLRDTTMKCWGGNMAGEIGDSTFTAHPGVPTLSNMHVNQIDTSYSISGESYASTCVLAADGSGVYCWGSNTSGRNGQGTLTPASTNSFGASVWALWR